MYIDNSSYAVIFFVFMYVKSVINIKFFPL